MTGDGVSDEGPKMHLGISQMVWDRAEYIAYAASYTRMVPFLQAKPPATLAAKSAATV